MYVKQLVEHVEALEAAGWKVPTLFDMAAIRHAIGDDVNTLSFYNDATKFGGHDTWRQLLEESEKVFEILGIHLGPWKANRGFSNLLMEKAEHGCAIRIQLMHPDNPALPRNDQ